MLAYVSKLTLYIMKCNQCGHMWLPRVEDVRQCPKCRSLHWDRPKRKATPRPEQSVKECGG